MTEFLIKPTPGDPRLSQLIDGIDQTGAAIETVVVAERAITLFLNAREIVTVMTIGDHPELLAVGYLLNQNMLLADDEITGVEYDDDIATVVVRTRRQTDYEEKLKKKVQTSGCAQGTVFGDLMEAFDTITLSTQAQLKTRDVGQCGGGDQTRHHRRRAVGNQDMASPPFAGADGRYLERKRSGHAWLAAGDHEAWPHQRIFRRRRRLAMQRHAGIVADHESRADQPQ